MKVVLTAWIQRLKGWLVVTSMNLFKYDRYHAVTAPMIWLFGLWNRIEPTARVFLVHCLSFDQSQGTLLSEWVIFILWADIKAMKRGSISSKNIYETIHQQYFCVTIDSNCVGILCIFCWLLEVSLWYFCIILTSCIIAKDFGHHDVLHISLCLSMYTFDVI